MRDIKYYSFYETEAFERQCIQELETLCKQYNFYYSNECYRISKDINTVVGKKPDFYSHKVTLYYDDINVYLVAYTKKFIVVEVLMKEELNTNRYVHGLLKKFKDYKTVIQFE